MRFAFTDDQKLLAAGLGDLLSGECPPARVRLAWDDGTGHDAALWAQLAGLGLFAVLVPADAGGMGGGMVDVVLLAEQLGRYAAPGPVIEQMVAVAPLLAGTDDAEAVAAGTLIGTAVDEPGRVATGVPSPGRPVPHAGIAHVVVGPDGVRRGFTTTAVDSLDGGRRLAVVDGGTLDHDLCLDDPTRDRLALAVAAQQIGIAGAMVNLAAEYARQRHQFGKPIGSFQAVKHLLADALLAVEFAKAPTWKAAWALDNGQPTAPADVSAARVLADEAARRAARSALQVHGAIGYTWECDLHLWMKKVWALQSAWGTTSWHRRRVSRYLLGTGGGVEGWVAAPDGDTIPGLDQVPGIT
jgi:alkylation response protein AidB-like acyl-CoA dehydrogenase